MTTDKGGRPRSILDWEKIDSLLICGCSGREIASSMGLHPSTIYERCVTDNGITFAEYSQQKYEKGDSLLKQQQFLKAMGKTTDGDNTMLVWLGKNRLKQRDKQPDEVDNQVTIKVIDARNNNSEEV